MHHGTPPVEMIMVNPPVDRLAHVQSDARLERGGITQRSVSRPEARPRLVHRILSELELRAEDLKRVGNILLVHLDAQPQRY